MDLSTIKDIPNLKGKKVLLRIDVSGAVEGGGILDDFRIRKIVPTLRFLRERGARTLIIAHAGRDPSESLAPVRDYLKKEFSDLLFCTDLFNAETTTVIASLTDGGILLFENIRKYPEETANDAEFARHLASLADVYVNDAFAVSHREHASIVGVPQYLPSYIGLLFEDEIKNLSQAFHPPHPALFIVGGIKFETKLPLLKKFFPIADRLFVGGALANDVFKKKGFEVGASIVSGENFDLGEISESRRVILPADVMVRTPAGEILHKRPEDVAVGEMMLDVGVKTIADIKDVARETRFVLWNGPLGNHEEGFSKGTEDLARVLAESSGITIVGGGDTLVAISKLGLEEKFTFVSTGGGAMLDFLANETLPGIEAIEKNVNSSQ